MKYSGKNVGGRADRDPRERQKDEEMEYLLIRNARLSNLNTLQTILVADGRIIEIGKDIQPPMTSTTDLDAGGKYLIPTLISLCNPRPLNIDVDSLNTLNFENLTSGQATIVTVSHDIEENIKEFKQTTASPLNYSLHFPLRQLGSLDAKRCRKIMLADGVTTAILRLGEEKKADVSRMEQQIDMARQIGLRVVFDFRGLIDGDERMKQLSDLSRILQRDKANKAMLLGIEYEEELAMTLNIQTTCNLHVQLCYDPFGQSPANIKKLSAQTIATYLRQNEWCSLGLAYSVGRANREGWPDMTPEIVSRNILPLLAGMHVEPEFSVSELVDYTTYRPASVFGLTPSLATLSEGASANLIVWDDEARETAKLDTPRGNIQEVKMKGKIEAVVMNGKIVMTDKFNAAAVCGKHFYAR